MKIGKIFTFHSAHFLPGHAECGNMKPDFSPELQSYLSMIAARFGLDKEEIENELHSSHRGKI